MKKFFKLLGVIALAAVIGFLMAACGDDGGGGRNGNGNGNQGGNQGGNTGGGNPGGTPSTFTLTGIPSQYNGKYAFMIGLVSSSFQIVGFQGGSDPVHFTPVLISGGSANIPLILRNGTTFSAYTGNDTVAPLYVYIGDYFTGLSNNSNYDGAWMCLSEIAFSNGGAARNWSTGMYIPRS